MISFTVITCTYNAANVLQTTIDSVLSQTVPCLQHIIMDGASTDGTVAMAEAYKEKSRAANAGHSVDIVSEPDNGLYDAMNKAMQLSTCDYIVFLNAGDSFPSPDTLRTVTEAAGEAPLPGVIYGDTDIVDEGGNFLRHRRLMPPREGLSWKSFRNGMLVCHQAFYVLNTIARQTPYDLSFRFSSDVDWCIRVMKLAEASGRSIVRVPAVVANYLDGGMTTAHHRASLIERFNVMTRHYGLPTTIFQHLRFILRTALIPFR